MFKNKIKKLPSYKINTGKNQDLVSIVLPVYNGEKYLNESIDSVLKQTYKNWELIIVDDGSTDNSNKISNKYLSFDSRIKLITQENQKLPSALNNGFNIANGEFYTWLSADNRLLPEFLEELIKELKNNKNIDMVFGNQYLIDENGERIIGHNWFEYPKMSGRVCFPKPTPLLNIVPNNTIGAAFMYRAGADLALSGYSKNLFLLEDYDFFMKMNSFFKIKHIKRKKPIYEYRFHKESLTSKDKELGITASRPALMKFDSYRRDVYNKKIELSIDECISSQKPLFFNFKDDKEKIKVVTPYYIKSSLDNKFLIYFNDNFIASIDNIDDLVRFLEIKFICDFLRDKEKSFFVKKYN